MTEPHPDLTPADPTDLAEAISFALRFGRSGSARNADELLAQLAAARVVEYLERSGFVVSKRPAEAGHAGLARGKNEEL